MFAYLPKNRPVDFAPVHVADDSYTISALLKKKHREESDVTTTQKTHWCNPIPKEEFIEFPWHRKLTPAAAFHLVFKSASETKTDQKAMPRITKKKLRGMPVSISPAP